MRNDVLQALTTQGGSGSVIQIIQEREGWLDTRGAAGLTFHIYVRKVDPVSGGSVSLTLESGPSDDEDFFSPMAGPITLTPSSAPLVVTSLAGAQSLAPHSSWVRWHLRSSGTGDWAATFQIRVLRSRTPIFSPAMVPGNVGWYVSSLGITISPDSGNVNTWADQSGQRFVATATGNIGYSTSGGANGMPRLTAANNGYLSSSVFSNSLFPANIPHTLFAVVTIASAANLGICAATIAGGQDTGFSLLYDAVPDTKGRVSSSLMANSDATVGSVTTSPAIYSTAGVGSGNVDLLVNGGLTASANSPVTVSPGAPTQYILGGTSAGRQFSGDMYEFIFYNSVLSPNQRTLVTRYLGARYGISVP